MRTQTWLKSATLGAAVLAMIGCSDGDTTVNEADSVNNLWDDNSVAINDSAWAVPQEGVFYNTDNYTFEYDVSATAEADARSGADKHDLGVDWTITGVSYGDVSYYPVSMTNGNGDSNFAATGVQEFDEGAWDEYYLAKGADGAIYVTDVDGHDWQRGLPASTKKGTSWVESVDTLDDYIGSETVAFLYKEYGTVSYAPRYNVNANGAILESAPGATEDLADETSGPDSDNYIVYSSGTGYDGDFVNSNDITVVTYNVIEDDKFDLDIDGDGTVDFEDTIQVKTTMAFRVNGVYDPTLTSNIGLAEHSGESTWYWKKDMGVVYETGSLTYPALGYWFGSDDTEAYDGAGNTEDDNEEWLAQYNADYDAEIYLVEDDVDNYNDSPSDPGHPAYLRGYYRGFDDGYEDDDTRENAPNDVIPSSYWDADQDDDDNASDVAGEAAFRAGYSLGFSRGVTDYNADFSDSGAQVTGGPDVEDGDSDGPDFSLDATSTTDIPTAYRAIDYWGNYLDGYGSLLVDDYTAGYDGWGIEVMIYDGTVTTGNWGLVNKPILDARNEEDVEVFVKLPAIGRTITKTWTQQQTANPAGPEADN